jgi:predicted RNase H-like nuclease (RuvC/YqgF family)
MKMNGNTPSELIEHIGDIIKERQVKNLPTYFTISIEQYDKTTPVVEREKGYDNFKQLMLKYTSNFDLNSITVALYHGKSPKVKHPFQNFKIQMKNQSSPVVLSTNTKDVAKVEQLESSIPVGRYYDEKFDYQMRLMRSEIEKQTLADKLSQIIDKYEEKIKSQEEKNHEKVKELEEEIEELEEDIREFEKEIARNEREKHNSFGNIALGSIGTKIAENFAKSDVGMGVLKGLLGETGFETLQGHLKGIEEEKKQSLINSETARVLTENDANNPRQVALNFIQKVAEALPDMQLRFLYDIVEMSANNKNDLQILWDLSRQIIAKRKEQPVTQTSEVQQNTTPVSNDQTDDVDPTKID